MTDRPTIADVARAAGVSKGLVSLTLNDRPGVAGQTRDRIRAAASELSWHPNPSARGLSKRRAYSLGLIVRRDPITFEVDPFFAAFVAGVERVLAARGQVLVLSIVQDEATEVETYRRLSSDNRVDGYFITDLLNDDPRIALTSELGAAAVTLGRPGTDSPFPAITRDYEKGIHDLVGHLAALGHTRIAHVTGDERMQHARNRLARFRAVMDDFALEPFAEAADFSPESGSNATRRLLEKAHPPTAVIYANDPMAIAGMAVAHERGLSLPGDLSIAGMDGADMGHYTYPTLTTLDNDPGGWGRAAADALVTLIEGGAADDIALPAAALIARESTSAPLARTPRSAAASSLHAPAAPGKPSSTRTKTSTNTKEQ